MKKLTGILCAFAIFAACPLHADGQLAPGVKTKVKSDYSWPKPGSDSAAFNLVSLDGKRYGFYVQIGEFYVPISTAPRNTLGSRYVLPKSKNIKLFDRKVEDGMEIFEPVADIDTKGFDDFIAGIFPKGDSIASAVLDISLENMPEGTMNVVNLQPFAMGIRFGKQSQVIKMMGHYKKPLNSRGRLLAETLNVFDLRNPKKPKPFYSYQFRFPKNMRSILYVTGLNKSNNGEADLVQFLSVCDSGPRS